MKISKAIFIVFALSVIIWTLPFAAYADSDNDQNTDQVSEETADIAKSEHILSFDKEPVLGRVRNIEFGGRSNANTQFIKDQLAFEEGDYISLTDLTLATDKLRELGMFKVVDVHYATAEPAHSMPQMDNSFSTSSDTINDIVVFVDVQQDSDYYFYPYMNGGVAGNRNFLYTGRTFEVGYFDSNGTFEYWHARMIDPNSFNGKTKTILTTSHFKDMFGVRSTDYFDYGENYILDRESFEIRFQNILNDKQVWDFGIEYQNNQTEYSDGEIFEETNTFFLSEEDFSPGKELIFKTGLSGRDTIGSPWTTKGYRWSLGTEQSSTGFGSDHSFGRYYTKATKFIPVNVLFDTAVLHGEYSLTSGEPPHYLKSRLGYLMRGHYGPDYFNESTILLSCEARKAFLDDRVLGVAFVDFGKGFDSGKISFKDLDTSAGFGLRIDMSQFSSLDFILRVDFAWGPYGDRIILGFGEGSFWDPYTELDAGQSSGVAGGCGPGG